VKDSCLSERAAGTLAVSLFAGAIGFCIGWKGPAGLLLIPFVLPVVVCTAGPGSALLGVVLSGAMQDCARRALSSGEIWLKGLLLGIALGLLNIPPALLLWKLCQGGTMPLGFSDLPFAYVLGGVWGGCGLGYGACHGLEPEGTP
jgi:hypothetical protein